MIDSNNTRVAKVNIPSLLSEGDEVAGLPTEASSPRVRQCSPHIKSVSTGQRRRRTIYIAGMYGHSDDGGTMWWCCQSVVSLTVGRPPWYDSEGQIAEAFVIGNQSLIASTGSCPGSLLATI